MSNFDRFIYGAPLLSQRELAAVNEPIIPPPVYQYAHQDDNIESDSDSDELTLDYIIDEKPSTKVVREFFRAALASIKSEEEKLFD